MTRTRFLVDFANGDLPPVGIGNRAVVTDATSYAPTTSAHPVSIQSVSSVGDPHNPGNATQTGSATGEMMLPTTGAF